MHEVEGGDEWCAEAYMETDYSSLSQSDFAKVVRNYAIYRLLGENLVCSLSGSGNDVTE